MTDRQKELISKGFGYTLGLAVMTGVAVLIAERAMGLPGKIDAINERSIENRTSIGTIAKKIGSIAEDVSRIDERTKIIMGGK